MSLHYRKSGEDSTPNLRLKFKCEIDQLCQNYESGFDCIHRKNKLTKAEKGSNLLIITVIIIIHSAVFSPVSKVSVTCVCVSGQRRDCPLFYLYVETASETGWHRCARRGGGVRVSTGEQQKLHVLRAAVPKRRTPEGLNQSCLGNLWEKKNERFIMDFEVDILRL